MSYANPTVEETLERRAELAPLDSWNERTYSILYAIICAWQGIPKTHLDIGSGTGAMVNMARKMGVESYGVDVINGPEHWFIHHDLTDPLHLVYSDVYQRVVKATPTTEPEKHYQMTFDIVTCIEVAEHLPEESSSTLCDTIARHLTSGGLFILSAATPGQAGEHHVNCQHASFWRSLLHDRGVSYREDYTRQLSHLWSWVAGPMSWLAGNVVVFDK